MFRDGSSRLGRGSRQPPLGRLQSHPSDESRALGQQIKVLSTQMVDDVLLIDTDRTLGGQDGEGYEDPEVARSHVTFPAQLAARLMDLDPGINRVFTLSNTMAVRRTGGWASGEVDRVSEAVSGFFLFYRAG